MVTPPELSLITRSQLEHDLQTLGVGPGQTMMLHVSVRAIGWIVGGPDVVIQALLNLLTPAGTLMMYAAWEERPDDWWAWSPGKQAAYQAECPPFNPATSRAYRKWSILAEYLRTWPGACRSGNPGASMVAVGAHAQWLTRDHPLQYGYGPGSPLAKLCELDGYVLQIGVSPGALTLIHHAEHVANIPNKRIFRYPAPLLENGQRVWVTIEEYDTGDGVVEGAGGDYLEQIAIEFRQAGHGCQGRVGVAPAFLGRAAELNQFAVAWLERTFGSTQD
ncbi:MAG: aminoglycoside 3-N-acetyltransferase [Anaerolineae bacterium]|nr:aminoglycoside 3-N-acetyltransferase [Anaerolineae bacterium]